MLLKRFLSIMKGLPDWAKIAIATCGSIALVCAFIALIWAGTIGQLDSPFSVSAPKSYTGPSEPYIAKLKVVGAIGSGANQYYSSDSAYHHAWTLQTVDTLIGDGNNKGIYLWLDTPGGTVYESDELYLKLMEYKEKTGRPIYAYMGKLAASGGYYVASASDGIYANRNTWTGSIGVTLGTIFDVSEFLSGHGIYTDTITSGRNKAMGNYYEPLTDEQRNIYQSLVDDAFGRFVAIVAQGRGLAENDVRELADGRLYTAGQALDAGLIDGILGEKEAEEEIKAKFEGGIAMSDCYYKPDKYFSLFSSSSSFSIWDLLRGSAVRDGSGALREGDAAAAVRRGDIAAVLELVREQADGAPPLKYQYMG